MNKKQQNENVFSNISHHYIPKWNDLPEIDLYMDQVIVLMEKYLLDNPSSETKLITPSMINNYVKLGIMPAPIKKKYSREHLAYLVIICSLKQVMPISNIKEMINQKLKNCTISETLDFYSDLYEVTFKTVINTCSDHLKSHQLNIESFVDTQLFTAIAAANCRNICEQLFENNKT